ncbi:hypothetical protein TRM7557_00832 [Tritonibacter multivorans]|uniref:AlgX/AlgJ SGNH hydrolase-like domain-containing protein n=1 Tax=Tritonibacter multivorans TaxID=928856 RepID=A0A0P1GLQ0_9RHOB|nr:hypothetical protein [Tritonibacter multivorans]MDA7422528.1 hypothetical protein [Tritonibacter multivorans]CUH76318.1 hypothetical protein TRM7557_00832 [Tritonibacter multivorans]SFD39966.1 SGNH hydrolase-like domain-containing protein, acetyltransferase AlgX [Tritonibacter multivorans]
MKTLFVSALVSLGLSAGVMAMPYCSDLTSVETLPKKYQKRGPFYSDSKSGWIIGADQLKGDFTVTEETMRLWQAIAAEFQMHGVQLVVLAAPPRPLFTPPQVLKRMGLTPDEVQKPLQRSFSAYIAALNAAGIPAPDLTVLTQEDGPIYFKRDTHWTPEGAARSAALLRAHLDGTSEAGLLAKVPAKDQYEEKGSLARVVEDSCGQRPEPETVAALNFTREGSAEALLAVSEDMPGVVLVGTSYSDRYQRDAYRVADALAHTLDSEVDNWSLTGGGRTGAMSAFLYSGGLDAQGLHTVIWESPYTTPLTQISGLRQVLGDLRTLTPRPTTHLHSGTIGTDWQNLQQSFSADSFKGMQIQTPGHDEGRLAVELISADGKKTRVKLDKSKRLPQDLRTDTWTFSFEALEFTDVARLKLRLANTADQPFTVTLYR